MKVLWTENAEYHLVPPRQTSHPEGTSCGASVTPPKEGNDREAAV